MTIVNKTTELVSKRAQYFRSSSVSLNLIYRYTILSMGVNETETLKCWYAQSFAEYNTIEETQKEDTSDR